ncbi:MAG: two-component system sensor histidine kinase RppB [Cyanobacteriota bacterium]|nr:two-component system sensor histidine kinase RppB [Cyanobacteriota bacterium]
MKTQRLFHQTRWRLTCWYAGVMGATVLAGGILLYHCLAITERWWFDRTVADLAGTLHDYLQPKLDQPGELDPDVAAILLGTEAHNDNLIGVTRLRHYYVRVLDPQGQIVLKSSFQPEGIPASASPERWQTFTAAEGTRYRQIDDYLHTRSGQIWGYLQLGRSLAESDEHLRQLIGILFLSTPLAMGGVAIVGWWLAGVAMQPIRRSYHQMQQFTADAAHELRTPLATSRTLTQNALKACEQGKSMAPETLHGLLRQNERLTHLVTDLLLLSRLDQASPQRGCDQRCCLNDILADLQEELAPLALEHQISLTMELPKSPVHTKGDEDQLYRLFLNLISNGILYTPAGGQVNVTLQTVPHHAVIQVEDTGIGIPPEKLPYLFNRFYRVDQARARHTGGTGLGLSIAQAIAQAHRGEIWVQSQLGQGSTFRVTLPTIAI